MAITVTKRVLLMSFVWRKYRNLVYVPLSVNLTFSFFLSGRSSVSKSCSWTPNSRLVPKISKSNVSVTQEVTHSSTPKLFARSYRTSRRFSPNAGHFRGRWKSFSPLGKQSALRTDSLALSLLRLQQSHQLWPQRTSTPVRLFFLQHKLNEKKKNCQLSARTTTISLCIQDPVGPFPLSNTPSLPLFFPFLFALL